MAKIDTLIFEINGKIFKSNINVRKNGLFSCKLNWEVGEALGLSKTEFLETTKGAITDIVDPAYYDYINSKKETHLFIGVTFKINGNFNKDVNGVRLCGWGRDEKLDHFLKKGFASDDSVIQYKFDVFAIETKESDPDYKSFYSVKKATENFTPSTEYIAFDYYKDSILFKQKGDIIIPFTPESYKKLSMVQEVFRSYSELLFNFLCQDQQALIEKLNNNISLLEIKNK